MKNIVVYILIVLWLAVALLLFVPLLHSQDEPKTQEHTFIIVEPDPLPIELPEAVDPNKCMEMQVCAQRLLLKS